MLSAAKHLASTMDLRAGSAEPAFPVPRLSGLWPYKCRRTKLRVLRYLVEIEERHSELQRRRKRSSLSGGKVLITSFFSNQPRRAVTTP